MAHSDQLARLHERYASLLVRRVPRKQIEIGRAYVIHARNGGVGVAVENDGVLGYRLHRVKFGHHYLFVEYDYEDDRTFGTTIPLALISEAPPADEAALLPWLRQHEIVNQTSIAEAWSTVLGSYTSWAPEA